MTAVQIATAATAKSGKKVAKYLVDTDVHPVHDQPLSAFIAYMPEAWKRRLDYISKNKIGGGRDSIRHVHPRGKNGHRQDARTPEGGKPGSDPRFVVTDLLDRYGIDFALLFDTAASGATMSAADSELGAVLASAYNDYLIEHWLSIDKRYRLGLVVSPNDVGAAVAEIRRHGKHPQVAGVFLPMTSTRWGNRQWYPIYEAAIEEGLPIVSHVSQGEVLTYDGAARHAAGVPELWGEKKTDFGQICQAQVTSLVWHGVFERYKDLKIVFSEWGFTWLVPHIWKMNEGWRESRSATPWLKRWPEEIVRDHMRFSTQPIPEPKEPRIMELMVRDYLTDILVFSTDYPHYDGNSPDIIFPTLEQEILDKVFYANAMSVLRL